MIVKALIDRIEENQAVVLLEAEEKRVNWPLKFLPEGAKEGQVLHFKIKIDLESTKAREDEVEKLWKEILD